MARYLLDTHVFLWLIQDDPQLSDRAKEVIANNESQLNFSVVSIWEIVIKLNIGKLKIGHKIEDIYTLLAQTEIEVMPIESSDLERYLSLPLYHRDPFDRLIISQAIDRDLILMSADAAFEPYPVQRLW
ncbi:type II toxin-antitoxin system VapC family toxin [Chamaesiphon polymorphus]|uniref:PIN domain nuclease n=1 Tax=Chamaesiphon polymorphus CCALA 037 TaxID=2107692 RepID=A0A2T1GJR0_9CYAN|nr:type II toxin-antitoxin system VapC family toxin [Chamaesiphon polymorphus]PSB58038.1 PIN domain nuclease [Chamaesiphon polymorphus CCALA 037]